MNRFSPNLTPNQAYKHTEHARRLGVPKTNVLDLRSSVEASASSVTTPAPNSTKKTSPSLWQRWFKSSTQPKPVAKQTASTKQPVAVKLKKPTSVEVHPPVQSLTQKVSQTVAPSLAAASLSSLTPEPSLPLPPAPPARSIVIPTAPVPPIQPLAVAPVPRVAQPRRPVAQTGQRWIIKPLATFVLLCVVCVMPFATLAFYKRSQSTKATVTALSAQAVDELQAGTVATSEFNFMSAEQSFDQAALQFSTAQEQLQNLDHILAPVLATLPGPGQQFASADHLLKAGTAVASAGSDVSQAFAVLSNVQVDPTILTASNSNVGLTDVIMAAHALLRPAAPRLQLAALEMQQVDLAAVPEEYREQVQLAQDTLPVVADSFDQLLHLNEALLTVLGHDETKRYLVLFQNNREMRATGGFIGSFAVVEIRKGRVQSIEIPGGGPYDLLGGLDAKVISPQPLHLINPHWQMQDANWWPDFPTSAEKIQWFYEASGGTSVDGVLTLTPDSIEQLLHITGPIDMPEYGVTITEDNFYSITQVEAERKFDDTRESKKFIADLTPRLLNAVFTLDRPDLVPVLQVLYTGLLEKDILLYFNDPFLQTEMTQLGWTGAMRDTTKDYLMVVDTNIGGGKTDAAIAETIEHHATIQDDGSIIDEVTVTRVHNGQSDDTFTNINNVDYIRLYVPAGSELITAEGFVQPPVKSFFDPAPEYETDKDVMAVSGDTLIHDESQTRINEELGKTVFGNWMMTKPGETSRATIRYRLPFKLETQSILKPVTSYSLLVQKQPGAFDPVIVSNVHYPVSWKTVWAYPSTTQGQLHTVLTRDQFAAVVLEP